MMPRIAAWSLVLLPTLLLFADASAQEAAPSAGPAVVDRSTVRGKVLCGYQGWFRTPDDGTGEGFVHWSRNPKALTPRTLTVEMWPDLAEVPAEDRAPVAEFTDPDGSPAALFSSANPRVVARHFEWMRRAGIDGVWLQHFLVDCPGGPLESRFASRQRVMDHVRAAAAATGRVWALTIDLSGLKGDRAVDLVAREWHRLVDSGTIDDPRYLREGGRPVVEVFGFYHEREDDRLSPAQAERLIGLFRGGPGDRYAAFLIGSGAWNWRRNPDLAWQAALRKLDGISPWNVGNTTRRADGAVRATTNYWLDDRREAEARGQLWLPVIYPGFGWDNLKRLPPGRSTVPRDGGRFLWDQFDHLAELGVDTAFVAMFDEVDEGTAILPVTNKPPTQARFLTYDGLPTDWYLRLTGLGGRMLRREVPHSSTIPIRP